MQLKLILTDQPLSNKFQLFETNLYGFIGFSRGFFLQTLTFLFDQWMNNPWWDQKNYVYIIKLTRFSAPGRFPLLARLTASSKLFNCHNQQKVLKSLSHFNTEWKKYIIPKEKEIWSWSYLGTDEGDNCLFIDSGQ